MLRAILKINSVIVTKNGVAIVLFGLFFQQQELGRENLATATISKTVLKTGTTKVDPEVLSSSLKAVDFNDSAAGNPLSAEGHIE